MTDREQLMKWSRMKRILVLIVLGGYYCTVLPQHLLLSPGVLTRQQEDLPQEEGEEGQGRNLSNGDTFRNIYWSQNKMTTFVIILSTKVYQYPVERSVLFADMGASLGTLPAEYNKAVHGPYDPAIYYGKKVWPFCGSFSPDSFCHNDLCQPQVPHISHQKCICMLIFTVSPRTSLLEMWNWSK